VSVHDDVVRVSGAGWSSPKECSTCIDDRDTRHLRPAIALAGRAREAGDPPFGSVLAGADGTVLVEAGQRSASMDRAAL
jgi:tRNA(Arg) A34 adenosine deaminase TadA